MGSILTWNMPKHVVGWFEVVNGGEEFTSFFKARNPSNRARSKARFLWRAQRPYMSSLIDVF
jgi:hypothetical protein